uniref:ArsR/SmtB family transcription factor n=1 Tax=Pararhizobium sp. IMCC3301 TaxID=3067904 RepID=UPI002741C40C|nr:metalloregulator ArsR/SmtB family transcription factor [Pararhizobium sp. IMCC3301]
MANYQTSIDTLFHALADPTRRAVVERLSQGSATVGELAEPVSMALPSFMQHLSVLEKDGIISSEKVGRVRTCHLRSGAFEALENWLGDRRVMWESRLDALENYLNNEQQN